MHKKSYAGVIASVVLLAACAGMIALTALWGAEPGKRPPVEIPAAGADAALVYVDSFEGVKSLELDVLDASVALSLSADHKVHVYAQGRDGFRVSQNPSGSLEISQRQAGMLGELFGSGEQSLAIAVPALTGLSVRSRSGPVSMHNLSVSNVDIDTASASIDISALDVPNFLRLSSTSGEIRGSRVYAEYLYLDSISGGIHLEECYTGDAYASSGSGDIRLELEMSAYVACDTASGRIALVCKAPVEGFLESVSGNIDITTAPEGQNVRLNRSGIPVNLVREPQSVETEYTTLYRFGPETLDLWVNTVSGNLTLR